MLAVLMLTSKGMAAVPRASLVVIAATPSQSNVPEAGLLLIMGIDHFLDMGRTATNVLGNAIASAVVAKWEGVLAPQSFEMDQLATAAVIIRMEGIRWTRQLQRMFDGRNDQEVANLHRY